MTTDVTRVLADTVGVVIVTHNPKPMLTSVVEAVITAAPAHIVIVDNGSIDQQSLDDVRDKHPDLTVLQTGQNLGFCAGNNIGLRRLPATTYVLFLNPDAIVAPTFLSDAIAILTTDEQIGALGPKLITIDPVTLAATGRLDSTGIFQNRYGRIFDRGQGEDDRGQFDGPIADVPGLCGAAMMCRRSALDAVASNGEVFDESFFMYKEDLDLSYRLARKGWRVVYAPSLAVGHVRSTRPSDRAAVPRWVRRRSLANEWRMWRKGVIPATVRLPMLGYLVVKSVLVWIGR